MPTGWVNELSAGPTNGAKGFMMFVCNMELTTDGQGNNIQYQTFLLIAIEGLSARRA